MLPLARSALEVAAELAFQDAVEVLDLLLLAEVDSVVGQFPTTKRVHPRRCLPPLERALVRVAAEALEEQLHPLAAAHPTNRSRISRHACLLLPITVFPH